MDESVKKRVLAKARKGQSVMIGYRLVLSLTEEEQEELVDLHKKHKSVRLSQEARDYLRIKKEN